MKIIDFDNWKRKEHFDFFSKYDNPFYGISTEIDCTNAFLKSKENGFSFFAYYLHKSISAVNIESSFKYRIHKGKVVIYDTIHAAATIARTDGTFGFSFIPFTPDFKLFNEEIKQEIQAVQNSTGLRVNNDGRRSDVIHFSSLPWIKFTGLSHASNFNTEDSVPKITFGKAFGREDKKILPIAIEVHHGLVDALHIANYLEVFQKLMNE